MSKYCKAHLSPFGNPGLEHFNVRDLRFHFRQATLACLFSWNQAINEKSEPMKHLKIKMKFGRNP